MGNCSCYYSMVGGGHFSNRFCINTTNPVYAPNLRRTGTQTQVKFWHRTSPYSTSSSKDLTLISKPSGEESEGFPKEVEKIVKTSITQSGEGSSGQESSKEAIDPEENSNSSSSSDEIISTSTESFGVKSIQKRVKRVSESENSSGEPVKKKPKQFKFRLV